MPSITRKLKRLPQYTTSAAEAKSTGLSGEGLKILDDSEGGRIAEQVAAAALGQSQHAKAQRLVTQIAKLEEELRALKVVETPKVILPALHDAENGRIDAQKVAEFMGVPLKRFSEGLGLNYKAVHRSPSAAGFQKALRPVKRSLELLHEFFGSAVAIRAWLNTPHPDLGGTSALETMIEGKAEVVTLILENAWNGVPV